MKSPLSSRTAKPEAGLERVVLGRHVRAPRAVALLEAKAAERAPAGGDQPVRPAGGPQLVPELAAHVGGRVQLPAELADVREPQRGHRHVPHVERAGLEVAEGLVRDVDVGQRRQHVPCLRPPQAQAAGAGRDVADRDAPVVRGVAVEPGQVEVAVGADLEPLRPEPGDRQVAADPAVLAEHAACRRRCRRVGRGGWSSARRGRRARPGP